MRRVPPPFDAIRTRIAPQLRTQRTLAARIDEEPRRISEREDYVAVATLEARYADLRLGLADCALVVLAHRCETTRIMTFDARHFRAVAPLAGGAFTLLPADE